MSDWSIRKVSPRNDSKDDGRVSLYFKSKSKELGKLSGEDGPRVHKFFLFYYAYAKRYVKVVFCLSWLFFGLLLHEHNTENISGPF